VAGSHQHVFLNRSLAEAAADVWMQYQMVSARTWRTDLAAPLRRGAITTGTSVTDCIKASSKWPISKNMTSIIRFTAAGLGFSRRPFLGVAVWPVVDRKNNSPSLRSKTGCAPKRGAPSIFTETKAAPAVQTRSGPS
jgi:hypothetical protein